MLNDEKIKRDIIVLGASAGGVETLSRLFQCLPADLPATIAVVHHRHPLFNSRLASVLSTRSQLPVVEPQNGEPFLRGKIYLAPRDLHMRLQNGYILLSRGPKEHSTRPAVDPLFCTAAATYKQRVIGIVLTGGGADGVEGLIRIKEHGGLGFAQDPSEAPMPYMPYHAIMHDHIDLVLSVERLPSLLTALAQGKAVPGLHGDASFLKLEKQGRIA